MNATAAAPHSSPSSAYSGISSALSRWCGCTGIAGSAPRSWIATTVATTEDSTTTLKSRVVNRRSSTSSAKNTPAIGALNVPAMPPAAPAATSSARFCSVSRSAWPTTDPTAAPRNTIGPCRPTDPPDPIVSAAATIFASAPSGGNRPILESSAAITSGIALPRALGTSSTVIGPTSSPPSAGIMISRALGSPPSSSSCNSSKKGRSLSSTSSQKPTAHSPAPRPTTAASTIGPARGDRSIWRIAAPRARPGSPLASEESSSTSAS